MGRQFVDPAASTKVLFIESMYYIPILPTMQVIHFMICRVKLTNKSISYFSI